MKARHIRKIKKQFKYYDVWICPIYSSLGVKAYGPPICTLLARNPCEAARRAHRKGVRNKDEFEGYETSSRWAHWAVRPSDKVSERFVTYYR